MDQWVLFGFGNYLSDIFDNIHANRGRVKAIVKNIELTEDYEKNLRRRISLLSYDVPIIDLSTFTPKRNEKYLYGFIEGRNKLVTYLKQSHKLSFSNLIHPTAHLGSNVSIGEGVFVSPNVVLAPNCEVGHFCSINRASSIGHDTVLGDFSTIGPGVTIAGLVKIGRGTTVGIGATITDRISIGDNSIVGAGSVVLDNIPDDVVVVGVPARILRKNQPA